MPPSCPRPTSHAKASHSLSSRRKHIRHFLIRHHNVLDRIALGLEVLEIVIRIAREENLCFKHKTSLSASTRNAMREQKRLRVVRNETSPHLATAPPVPSVGTAAAEKSNTQREMTMPSGEKHFADTARQGDKLETAVYSSAVARPRLKPHAPPLHDTAVGIISHDATKIGACQTYLDSNQSPAPP